MTNSPTLSPTSSAETTSDQLIAHLSASPATPDSAFHLDSNASTPPHSEPYTSLKRKREHGSSPDYPGTPPLSPPTGTGHMRECPPKPVLPGRGDAFYIAPVAMGDGGQATFGMGEHGHAGADARAGIANSGGGEKDTRVSVQAGLGSIEKQEEWEKEQGHPASAEQGEAISSDRNCTPGRSPPSDSARHMTYVRPSHDHFTDTPPLSLAADTAPPAVIACDTASPAFVNEATPSPPGVDTQPNKDKSNTDHEHHSPGEQVLQATILATI